MQQETVDKETSEEVTTRQLREELDQERTIGRQRQIVTNTIFILITVAAAAVLIATLALPIFHIYGKSMAPTLNEGDLILSVKGEDMKTGDLIAFYYNNKILIKRVIANSGDWVNIDESGNVFVNDQMIQEPYLQKKSKGICSIKLPYQVPDGKVFVMGDNRDISIDSRSKEIGCIAGEQIAGRLELRIWPLGKMGFVR